MCVLSVHTSQTPILQAKQTQSLSVCESHRGSVDHSMVEVEEKKKGGMIVSAGNEAVRGI